MRFAALILALFTVVPMFAADADITLPVIGYLDMPNDLIYRTELVITNHRDVPQTVRFELISNGQAFAYRTQEIGARKTVFLDDAGFSPDLERKGFLGALRLTAIHNGAADPLGQLDANAFVVGERGAGTKGSTRQEVEAIASDEYNAEEAVFLGVRHSFGTGAYTNVGIVNLHPTQSATFVVQFQYAQAVTIVVPPLSLRQVRIPGEGAGGRYARVLPENPALPWVSYASTVDFLTGDAYSGRRVPSDTSYSFPGGVP